MVTDPKSHWEKVYTTVASDQLGWYEPHLHTSLAMISSAGRSKDTEIIDVGGGASTLVDDLLGQGFNNITVLDLSGAALCTTQTRLSNRASEVNWIEGDITTIALAKAKYDIWHDRAVFHFLTQADDREKYIEKVNQSLKPGGHVIMGMFSQDAPPRCSGLPVQRYSLELLQNEFGDGFELQEHKTELHVTPGGVEQMFLFSRLQKLG